MWIYTREYRNIVFIADRPSLKDIMDILYIYDIGIMYTLLMFI